MEKSQPKKKENAKEKPATADGGAKKETRWQWFWRGLMDFISALPG